MECEGPLSGGSTYVHSYHLIWSTKFGMVTRGEGRVSRQSVMPPSQGDSCPSILQIFSDTLHFDLQQPNLAQPNLAQ